MREEADGSIEDFVRDRFSEEPEETFDLLVDRVRDIVQSLSEGNHLAYGIGRREFAAYEAKRPPSSFTPG